MTFGLECKKVKRTGFIPTFIVGGLLAAGVPVVNMAVLSNSNSDGRQLADDGYAECSALSGRCVFDVSYRVCR